MHILASRQSFSLPVKQKPVHYGASKQNPKDKAARQQERLKHWGEFLPKDRFMLQIEDGEVVANPHIGTKPKAQSEEVRKP